MQFETTIGVELRGAAKTYRNAGTAVHAVRGICRQPQHQQPKARSPSALTRLFDTDRHPAIRFSSTRVSDAGDGHLSVIGELYAGGGQVTLTLQPTIRQVGDRLHVDASATVDQRELGMTWSPLGMTRTPTTLTVHAQLHPDS